MTELSRFQKDVEVAATALEMRAENEDAKEEAIHLYRNSKYQTGAAAAGSCPAGIFSGGRCGGRGTRALWSIS